MEIPGEIASKRGILGWFGGAFVTFVYFLVCKTLQMLIWWACFLSVSLQMSVLVVGRFGRFCRVWRFGRAQKSPRPAKPWTKLWEWGWGMGLFLFYVKDGWNLSCCLACKLSCNLSCSGRRTSWQAGCGGSVLRGFACCPLPSQEDESEQDAADAGDDGALEAVLPSAEEVWPAYFGGNQAVFLREA